MQNENQNPTPANRSQSITPLNEEAVREHLRETQAPVPVRPANVESPALPAQPTQPSVAPVPSGNPPTIPDDFEWKPNTRLASRSKLLRNTGLGLTIGMPLFSAMSSQSLPMALSNPHFRPITLTILGIQILFFLVGLVLLLTKSSRLANSLLTVILIINALLLIWMGLTLNLVAVVLTIGSILFILKLKNHVKILA